MTKLQTLRFVPTRYSQFPLTMTMLDNEKSHRVVEVVNRELVTPYGLKTLSLGDPKFVGKCFGRQQKQRYGIP